MYLICSIRFKVVTIFISPPFFFFLLFFFLLFPSQLWVLTGDKIETAMNIGYSAGLLGPEMVLIRLQNRGQSPWALQLQFEGLIALFRQMADDRPNIERIYTNMQNSVNAIIFGANHVKKKIVKEEDIADLSVSLSPLQGMRRRKTGGEYLNRISICLIPIFYLFYFRIFCFIFRKHDTT